MRLDHLHDVAHDFESRLHCDRPGPDPPPLQDSDIPIIVAAHRDESAFTQLPKVPELIPRSLATCAIGLPVSRTSRTAPSRKS